MTEISINCEFGVELACVIPEIFYRHCMGENIEMNVCKGMKPFYWFLENVNEVFQYRTIDNSAAGLDQFKNNWIHGIDSLNNPGVLDYTEWLSPDYRTHYGNDHFVWNRPTVFLTNKFNLEHSEFPYGFFDIQCLYDMFTLLVNKGYTVIYKRAGNTEGFALDQNEVGVLHSGLQGIKADIEGVGVIDDKQLCGYFEHVVNFDDLVGHFDYNTTQLMVMANCSRFISVCGGNSILSSLWGGKVISYVHKGAELRPNYFGPHSYFRMLSGANVIPVYDVLGHINKKVYHHTDINWTGKNDYTGLLETVDREF